MVNLSVNAIFYLILAIVIVLILLPILYSRALRRRGKSASLRQFVWRDPELRQGLLEEQKKKLDKTSPPAGNEGESRAVADLSRKKKNIDSPGQNRVKFY